MDKEFYIATKECGCTVAACVPDMFSTRELAKRLSDWVKDGYTIDRVDRDEMKKRLRSCVHKEKSAALGA